MGAVAIALCILLIVRHINMKREQDRMEKEYQEAIKPVEYPDKLYASSFHLISMGPLQVASRRSTPKGKLILTLSTTQGE